MKKTTLLVLAMGVFSSTVLLADESGRATGGRPDPSIHSSYWRTEDGPAPQRNGESNNGGNGGSNSGSGKSNAPGQPSQPSFESGTTPQPYGDWFNWPDANGLLRRSNGHSGSIFSATRPSHAMPEPGGIGELAVCAFGLGVYAWRRRKV